jgi:uncharacterized protein (TIGR02145 family)
MIRILKISGLIIIYSFFITCKKSDPPLPILNTGEVFKTVKIGTQTWMAENLCATKYNDGTMIPLVTDDAAWSNLATPGFCWYNNDSTRYKNIFGAVYNWYTVNTGKLCPKGWHMPIDEEWSTLTTYLGGESIAGAKLKQAGTQYWYPNPGVTNETGFTALPAGWRYFDGEYGQGLSSFWWSSTESSATQAWARGMYNDWKSVGRVARDKRNGSSVRCIKDF